MFTLYKSIYINRKTYRFMRFYFDIYSTIATHFIFEVFYGISEAGFCWIVETIQKIQKQPPELFCKKRYLQNFANFTGKHLCWSLFLIKLQALGLQLYKKETPTKAISCIKFAKFLRTPI